jgi:hypothetical protein
MFQTQNDLADATGSTAETTRPRLTGAGALARLTIIGIALAAVAGRFAYFGGWFTPYEPTSAVEGDAVPEPLDATEPLLPTPNPPILALAANPLCAGSLAPWLQ